MVLFLHFFFCLLGIFLPLVVVGVVHLVDPVGVHRDVDLAIDLALADTWEVAVDCPLGRLVDALAANKLRIFFIIVDVVVVVVGRSVRKRCHKTHGMEYKYKA